jgi:hypothetical protein
MSFGEKRDRTVLLVLVELEARALGANMKE